MSDKTSVLKKIIHDQCSGEGRVFDGVVAALASQGAGIAASRGYGKRAPGVAAALATLGMMSLFGKDLSGQYNRCVELAEEKNGRLIEETLADMRKKGVPAEGWDLTARQFIRGDPPAPKPERRRFGHRK